MIDCPQCGEAIEEGTILCRYCGRYLNDKERQGQFRPARLIETITAPRPRTEGLKWKWNPTGVMWLGAALVVVDVIVILGFLILLSNGSAPAISPANGAIDITGIEGTGTEAAYAACKQALTRLAGGSRAPNFQNPAMAQVEDQGDGLFQVQSQLDTRDSTGRIVHAAFTCRVQRDRQGAWKLRELTLPDW